MIKPSVDADSGEQYRAFGVYGANYADWKEEYGRFRTPDCEDEAMYLIKANAPLNTAAHTNV